jgi:hypothetical protein
MHNNGTNPDRIACRRLIVASDIMVIKLIVFEGAPISASSYELVSFFGSFIFSFGSSIIQQCSLLDSLIGVCLEVLFYVW